ncbi:MAG: lipid II flippase MurJ [Armatimonadia bacterium]
MDDLHTAEDHVIPEEIPQAQHDDATAGRRMAMGGIIISFFLFLGKIAGYAKSMLISGYFGSDVRTDAFYKVYNVLIYGMYTNLEKTIRPAYLPQFVRDRKEEGEPKAWQVTSIIGNLALVFLLALTLFFELFAPQVIRLSWKVMAEDPVGFPLAVLMLRLMAPAVIFMGMSLIPELTLHAYKRFTLPAVAEFMFRTGSAAGIVVGVYILWDPKGPHGILAAALGALLGASLRFLTMLPGLWSRLRNYRALLNPFRSASTRTVFSLMPPLLLGMAAAYFRNYADSIYADAIGPSMYTNLTFARTMGDSALQIIPLAISFVVYPFLSEWAARGDRDKLAEALVGMTRVMAFIFVPISVAMMFMARPIITIVYEHGQMTSDDAARTALALFCYAPGLLFFALETSIMKWYFALQDTQTPNYWGAGMAMANVVIGYIGVMWLWPAGYISATGALATVALALTISKTTKVIILYGLLRKRIGHIDRRVVLLFTAKLALASLVMGGVIYLIATQMQPVLAVWQPPFAAKKMRMLALAAAVGFGGGGVFLVSAALLKIEELSMVTGFVAKKVRKRLGR